MKVFLIILLFVFSSQSYALQCKKLLSQSSKNIMNIERISEALMRNYRVSLKTDDHNLVGAWDLEARTLYARDGHIIPQESILAHELTHVATDLKLEKNPSLSDLARSVIFKAFNNSGDLNERLPYDMIPAGYQRVFGFDEVHAVLKEIRVSEAIAKKLKAEGDPRAFRFLRINRPLKKQVIQFLAASRFLFRQALTYLESNKKSISIYYEPRLTTVLENRTSDEQTKFKNKKLAESNLESVYDLWIEIPGVNQAPNMVLQLAISWPKDPTTIQSDSLTDIILIIRQALDDNTKLSESMKSLNLQAE